VFAGWQDLGIAKDLVFVPDLYNWDVNKDFTVNVFDNIIVGNSFGSTGPRHWIREDVNEDCCVSVFDMIVIGNHFGDDYTGCSNGYEDETSPKYLRWIKIARIASIFWVLISIINFIPGPGFLYYYIGIVPPLTPLGSLSPWLYEQGLIGYPSPLWWSMGRTALYFIPFLAGSIFFIFKKSRAGAIILLVHALAYFTVSMFHDCPAAYYNVRIPVLIIMLAFAAVFFMGILGTFEYHRTKRT
jgi:hypothetical protein